MWKYRCSRVASKNTGIFVKPWQFYVLADLEYPCILGEDFISRSKIVLDFDRKSLAIPDSPVEKIVPSIDEGNLDIDLTKTGLEESQKQELPDLFNSFVMFLPL
ncbi:uncharacterized protein TNCV_1203541 [Trichonephila clavipes]|nr:uncharacterized protein TNCV_1203541 [Trichonephila clavipes]